MAFCKLREIRPISPILGAMPFPCPAAMWAGSPFQTERILHTCRNEKPGKENLKGNLKDV